jgi:hypothetical protein
VIACRAGNSSRSVRDDEIPVQSSFCHSRNSNSSLLRSIPVSVCAHGLEAVVPGSSDGGSWYLGSCSACRKTSFVFRSMERNRSHMHPCCSLRRCSSRQPMQHCSRKRSVSFPSAVLYLPRIGLEKRSGAVREILTSFAIPFLRARSVATTMIWSSHRPFDWP